MELSNNTILITGGASGIGFELVKQLSPLNNTIIITGRDAAKLEKAKKAFPKLITIQSDVSDPKAIKALFERVTKEYPALNILINNAGWTQLVAHHNLDALTDDIFTRTFDVNVTGTWMLTKYAMPHLRKSQDGNVVNITSVAGVRAMGSSIAYSMSKAALNHMTILLAKACGPVRVNAVAPGLVETPWTKDWQNQHDGVKAITPLHRSATPEDCVEATLGLLRTTYATGQIFVVDGGLTQVM